uniref:Interleukin1 receptorassociated kinase 4 [Myotis brandtii] n=1 Tax=Lepeophtheirus salmonis TaxID=72036 RepID=A0A0K2SWB5_LEPSM
MTDLRKLGEIMAINEDWQKFMSLVPKSHQEPDIPKFTTENINTLNRVFPTSHFDTGMELLIHEWADMSIGSKSKRATIGYVRDLCLKGGFIRAADYLNHFVLGGERIFGCDDSILNSVEEVCYEEDEGNQEDLIRWDNLISEDMSSDSSSLFEINSTQSVHLSNSGPFIPVNDLKVHSFPLKYILKITKDFGRLDPSFKIGSGGYSEVFKGLTGQMRVVAVKRLKNTERKEYQFNNEIETIPNLFHPNIIKILGYCNESVDHLCLIYPFMENGSLECRLELNPPLTWPEKLNISQGIISGIVFLHEGAQKELIHRDIKTANVLIDINLRPKIIDFGFLYSKSRNGDSESPDDNSQTLAQRGTSAYMAPEVIYNIVHAKLDVFSFGVILIELITGLKAFDENREDRDLATHIQEHASYLDLIDKKSPPWDRRRIENWFKVALECTENDYIIRPKSRNVQIKLMAI